MHRIIVLFLAAATCFVSVDSGYVNDVTQLHLALSTSYETGVRPDEITNITTQFGLMYINDLDTRSERFQAMGFLMMAWSDGRLSWDPNSYGNLSYTKRVISEIWTPPIIIANSASGVQFINDDDALASVSAYLFSDGSVKWMSPANVDSQCSMDIQYYPFDTQECTVLVSSWMFTSYELGIAPDADLYDINLDLFEENGAWSIKTTSVESKTQTLHGITMPMVAYKLVMQRKYSYYLLNMMLPVVFLTLFGPLVFALPVESGEKNGFALTILLSMSVLITVVSDLIPPSSTTVCILSVYLLTAYVCATVQGFVVVLICRLHNKTSRGETPGSKVQSACRMIDRLLCNRGSNEDGDRILSSRRSTITPVISKDIKIQDDEEDMKEYTYEEFANLLDTFCLYVFYTITILLTFIFMIVLSTGDK